MAIMLFCEHFKKLPRANIRLCGRCSSSFGFTKERIKFRTHMNIETTQVVPSSASMSQVEALTAQLAAYVRFKETGEAVHAVEAARLSKISGIAIDDNGLIRAVQASTFVNEVFTENTGGGCMVDFIALKDGRFVTLNDEAIGVFSSVDSFYEDGGESALHFMWIEPARKYALRSADSLRTDDGYVFKKQADGSYTDGDMSFSDLDSLFKQCEGRLYKVDSLQAVEVQVTSPVNGQEDVAIAAPALRIKVSVDGGESFVDANQGVRIIYEGVSIPDEDEVGTARLHLHATHEGLISDIFTTQEYCGRPFRGRKSAPYSAAISHRLGASSSAKSQTGIHGQ
jgi:hypothetical protein